MQLSTRVLAGPQRRENLEGEVEELRTYLQNTIRELDVLLKNLDEGNFNPKALERIIGEEGGE